MRGGAGDVPGRPGLAAAPRVVLVLVGVFGAHRRLLALGLTRKELLLQRSLQRREPAVVDDRHRRRPADHHSRHRSHRRLLVAGLQVAIRRSTTRRRMHTRATAAYAYDLPAAAPQLRSLTLRGSHLINRFGI